jgi:hypothetical protein
LEIIHVWHFVSLVLRAFVPTPGARVEARIIVTTGTAKGESLYSAQGLVLKLRCSKQARTPPGILPWIYALKYAYP